MNEIAIRRKHGKTSADARASAERLASEMCEEFDLSYAWDGDLMRFKRPGISGELMLDGEDVALHIHLGILLSALKPAIELEVHKCFDENFAA